MCLPAFISLFFISSMAPVSQAGPGSFSSALQDDARTDLSEVKGLLEITLLEKHFLREYPAVNYSLSGLMRLRMKTHFSQCY